MKCTCVQCGKSFELSDSEIDFYRKKNLHLPKRCKECRQKNKQKQGMSSRESNSWNKQDQYDAAPGQDNKKIGKWVYGVIIVAVLLLILGIKVSRSAFESYDEGYTYSAEDVQNDFSRDVDTGRSEPVNPAHVEQNKVANVETVDPEPDDTINTVEPEPVEVSASTEPIPNDSDAGNTEPELIVNTEPEQIAAADTVTADPIQDSSSVVRQYYFRNAELLEEHYQKHGVEMGFASAEEYQAAASAVVLNENSLHKLEAEDGDDVYYLEATNDFVIVSTDGYIRTYFRPDSGINYYNKQ